MAEARLGAGLRSSYWVSITFTFNWELGVYNFGIIVADASRKPIERVHVQPHTRFREPCQPTRNSGEPFIADGHWPCHPKCDREHCWHFAENSSRQFQQSPSLKSIWQCQPMQTGRRRKQEPKCRRRGLSPKTKRWQGSKSKLHRHPANRGRFRWPRSRGTQTRN